jgi:hypothetical protein
MTIEPDTKNWTWVLNQRCRSVVDGRAVAIATSPRRTANVVAGGARPARRRPPRPTRPLE